MKKILCFTLLSLSSLMIGCQSAKTTDIQIASENSILEKDESESQSCIKLGSVRHFNDQRIIAFQKLVELQILRIKAQTMSEVSTEELAELETLRRRVSYPLLTSSLRPVVVTKVLTREAHHFSVILDAKRKTDPQSQILYDEVKNQFLPVLENEEHWNCLEKRVDFEEDRGLEKTPDLIPEKNLEKSTEDPLINKSEESP